jgi:hypothetical protein
MRATEYGVSCGWASPEKFSKTKASSAKSNPENTFRGGDVLSDAPQEDLQEREPANRKRRIPVRQPYHVHRMRVPRYDRSYSIL